MHKGAGTDSNGVHYNPAVTLGVFIRGKCPTASLVLFFKTGRAHSPFVAQSAAAAFAAESQVARSIQRQGVTFMGLVSPTRLGIDLTADFLGGAAAALVFRSLNPGDQ